MQGQLANVYSEVLRVLEKCQKESEYAAISDRRKEAATATVKKLVANPTAGGQRRLVSIAVEYTQYKIDDIQGNIHSSVSCHSGSPFNMQGDARYLSELEQYLAVLVGWIM